jgi:hypothetical protein
MSIAQLDSVFTGDDNAPMRASRSAWSGCEPDVLLVADESAVKKHGSYRAAKQGSDQAASDLVCHFLAARAVRAFAALVSAEQTLVAVHAYEGQVINAIPAAMADWLASRFGAELDRSIVQINRVGHTGADGWHRLANQALFDGPVEAGRPYVLVDDFVGQGGTLANLRGYLMAGGGIVDGFIALTGQRRSATIALPQATLRALRDKHGTLEPWWFAQLGFGFDGLTKSEAEYLLRVEDADRIRDRVLAAGQGPGAR